MENGTEYIRTRHSIGQHNDTAWISLCGMTKVSYTGRRSAPSVKGESFTAGGRFLEVEVGCSPMPPEFARSSNLGVSMSMTIPEPDDPKSRCSVEHELRYDSDALRSEARATRT